MEKKILDSIIGDSTYDSRIRPSGLNVSTSDGMPVCPPPPGSRGSVTFTRKGQPLRIDTLHMQVSGDLEQTAAEALI